MKKLRSLLVLSLAALLVLALLPAVVFAAGGAFVDDDDSVFEGDIEWLAAAGVTLGCNPPTNDRFCPDDNVRRGQMAAFMRRFAAFLGAEDGQVAAADRADQAALADQANNANTVGGLLPGDIIRINGTMTDGVIDNFTSVAWTDIATMQIEAPVAGVIFAMGSVGLEDDSSLPGQGWIGLRLTIDGVPTHSEPGGYTMELAEAVNEPFADIGSLNIAVAVAKGQHTIALQAQELGSGTFVKARSLSAVFSAFGGGVPTIPVAQPSEYDN